jgi:predicted RND superfamily exporter protein
VTHPAAVIAGVVSVVAIVAVVGALRLSPDAGTDKLVDNDSAAFEGTQKFHERFGDDAIVVLAEGDLKKLMLTSDIDRLLALETCLAGRPDASGQYAAPVCQDIADLGATRVVFGPATFINEAAARSNEAILQQIQSLKGASPQEQQEALSQFLKTGLDPATVLQGLSVDNAQFVSSIVFDQTKPGAPPKSKFGYLFPSDRGALISIRLQPDVSESERRDAIGLIRTAVGDEQFALRDGRYEISGIPVVVQGLADELGGQIALLFGAALLVMAAVLLLVFGPPLRLLPLVTAIGSAGFAFGLLSLLGGSLTMASVAVLPVVIGLAVDYAIQLQARFRESAAEGRRPPAAAVVAAVRGGPVIATAALATAVGFLTLTVPPIRHGGPSHRGRRPLAGGRESPRRRDRRHHAEPRRPRMGAGARRHHPAARAGPDRGHRPRRDRLGRGDRDEGDQRHPRARPLRPAGAAVGRPAPGRDRGLPGARRRPFR